MTTTYDSAEETARQAATDGPLDRSLERLAELVGAKANVSAVFGEPIRQGDLTVVPVARVRWGVGGGSGKSDAAPDGPSSGSGGGGGAVADPVGYLEIAGADNRPNGPKDAQPSVPGKLRAQRRIPSGAYVGRGAPRCQPGTSEPVRQSGAGRRLLPRASGGSRRTRHDWKDRQATQPRRRNRRFSGPGR